MLKLRLVITLWLALLVALPLAAQVDCPAAVQTALEAAQQACGTLGRNEACYGNTLVSAVGWTGGTLANFIAPGNRISLFDLQGLITAPLDENNNTWGVALLAMQANLPQTVPGQNVTFVVFGDVELLNDVSPDVVEASVTLTATAVGSPNIRTAPSTGADLLDVLPNGATALVIGRTQGGNWYQIVHHSEARWVAKEFLQLDGNESDLPVIPRAEWTNPTLPYTAPMQAFQVKTGLRGPQCAEVPPGGVVVQAPSNTTVNVMVNGVELSIGSTALLRVDEDASDLQVATLGGTVEVKSGNEIALVEPGQITSAAEGSAPAEPQRYQYDQVRSLPLGLLPEAVNLPPPEGTEASVFACNFSGGALRNTLPSDQPIIFVEALGSGDETGAARVREESTVTLTFDGRDVPLWGVSDSYEKLGNNRRADGQLAGRSILYDWWFVVPPPEAGEFDVTLTWEYQETYTYACSLRVE